MRCNKARQEIIWERYHGAGSVVPFSLKAGNDIFFRFYLTKAELLALTYNDIDLEKRTISVNKSYQRIEGRDIITPPKTPKSKRIITIPPFLTEELKEYTSHLYGIMADERMFRFTKSYMEHEIIRGIKASGVKRIRLHDDRVIIGASQKKPSKIKGLQMILSYYFLQ